MVAILFATRSPRSSVLSQTSTRLHKEGRQALKRGTTSSAWLPVRSLMGPGGGSVSQPHGTTPFAGRRDLWWRNTRFPRNFASAAAGASADAGRTSDAAKARVEVQRGGRRRPQLALGYGRPGAKAERTSAARWSLYASSVQQRRRQRAVIPSWSLERTPDPAARNFPRFQLKSAAIEIWNATGGISVDLLAIGSTITSDMATTQNARAGVPGLGGPAGMPGKHGAGVVLATGMDGHSGAPGRAGTAASRLDLVSP